MHPSGKRGRPRKPRSRGQMPPYTMTCNACDNQWDTRARGGQVIRCTACRHPNSVPVRRPAPPAPAELLPEPPDPVTGKRRRKQRGGQGANTEQPPMNHEQLERLHTREQRAALGDDVRMFADDMADVLAARGYKGKHLERTLRQMVRVYTNDRRREQEREREQEFTPPGVSALEAVSEVMRAFLEPLATARPLPPPVPTPAPARPAALTPATTRTVPTAVPGFPLPTPTGAARRPFPAPPAARRSEPAAAARKPQAPRSGGCAVPECPASPEQMVVALDSRGLPTGRRIPSCGGFHTQVLIDRLQAHGMLATTVSLEAHRQYMLTSSPPQPR